MLRTNPKKLKTYLSNLRHVLDVQTGRFPNWRGPPSSIKILPIPGITRETYEFYRDFIVKLEKMGKDDANIPE